MLFDLNLAISAATKAGALILNYFESEYEIHEKGFNNPVTTADYVADQSIKETLMKNRPDYGWLSEETVDSLERLKKRKVWIVDPLDGTKSFIKNRSGFAINIALCDETGPVIGVVADPLSDTIYIGAKGHGFSLSKLNKYPSIISVDC